jgi:CheY-like chemotaxis protein
LTRVLIADDDHLMRAGPAAVLSSDPAIEVVGEAATGREAIYRTRRRTPDVVLMDVRMPDTDGIVHAVAAGDSLRSPSVTRRVIDKMASQPSPTSSDRATIDELTRVSGRC